MDSEVKLEQPGLIPKAPGVTEELVVLPDSKTRMVRRGEGGKFVKQKTSMPSTGDVTKLMRNFLNSAQAGLDGKLRKGDKIRMRRMLDNIFQIASMSSEAPLLDKLGRPVLKADGSPYLVVDAKLAMASVQAFKELMLRAYGKPSVSDEEIDALKTQGVKVVIVAPPELVNREVIEEKPQERLTPSFIDAEIIEDKR